jgi:hypothetical protein
MDFVLYILNSKDFIKKMGSYKLGYVLGGDGRDKSEQLELIKLIFSNKEFKDNPNFLSCLSYLTKYYCNKKLIEVVMEYFMANVDARDIKNINLYFPEYLSCTNLVTTPILNNKKWLYDLSTYNIINILQREQSNFVAHELATDDNILKKLIFSGSENNIKHFLLLISKNLTDKDLYEKIKERIEELRNEQ